MYKIQTGANFIQLLSTVISVLKNDVSIVQNENLGVGKLRSLIKVPQRRLQAFQLRVFGFGYGAKWKTRSGKTLEN